MNKWRLFVTQISPSFSQVKTSRLLRLEDDGKLLLRVTHTALSLLRRRSGCWVYGVDQDISTFNTMTWLYKEQFIDEIWQHKWPFPAISWITQQKAWYWCVAHFMKEGSLIFCSDGNLFNLTILIRCIYDIKNLARSRRLCAIYFYGV